MTANAPKRQSFLLLAFFILISGIAVTGCNSRSKEAQAGISISFDDQYIEEWYGMRGLLNRYNAKVTFFITRADSLTESERKLLLLLQQDGHEIGNHGSMHVNSEFFIKEHSYSKYLEEEVLSNSRALAEAGFTPTAFAYPYGAKYWFTDFMLLNHYKVLRGVANPNTEKGLAATEEAFYDHDNTRSLAAANIDVKDGLTKAMVDKAIERAAAQKQVLLLFGHKPVPASQAKGYSFSVDFLEYILEAAQKQQLKHYRLSDLHKE